MDRAEGDDIWAVTRYTRPRRSTVVPTISHRGVTAVGHADKAAKLMEISFPPPTPYDGDEGPPGWPIWRWTNVWWRRLSEAQANDPRLGWNWTTGHYVCTGLRPREDHGPHQSPYPIGSPHGQMEGSEGSHNP